MNEQMQTARFIKTKTALIANKLLSEPLSLLYSSFIGVILYKNLSATVFQVALLTMIKPTFALLALYWSASVHSRTDRLMHNVVWAGILSAAPFFLFPWVSNPWLFMGCAAVYIVFHRAGNPAWVEIMKQNIPPVHRGKLYSFATAFAYAEGVLLFFIITPWMNSNEGAWRWLFPVAAFFSLLSVFSQRKVPVQAPSPPPVTFSPTWKQRLTEPWRKAYELMVSRPDFLKFQIGFMLCGFGLMMVLSVLPVFFVDVLRISYLELSVAFLVCKGLGYVVTSRFWGRLLDEISIYKFMVYVHGCFLLFAVLLFLSRIHIHFLYAAYFLYGVAQSGSHLSWNLSGPIFSGRENSAAFSSVNILMVGLRGCIAPLMATLCCHWFGPYPVITICLFLSLAALLLMWRGLTTKERHLGELFP